jgi:ferritin-like metal-binding protein YciE
MNRINSLSDLFMEELADLLNLESQLVEDLPKLADACLSQGLKIALQECQKISGEHVNRLEGIFNNIGQKPQKLTCKAMQGLIAECHEAISNKEKSPASDAALVSVLQRVQQYEIARYKIVREHAADLDHTMIVELFTKTLNEDRSMNFHFNELAQTMINVQALKPQKTGQEESFYKPEGRSSQGSIKNKNTDISRFISEGNPNIQDHVLDERKDKNHG